MFYYLSVIGILVLSSNQGVIERSITGSFNNLEACQVYKEHIEAVGYYDESVENYGVEDCDMFKRLVQHGLKRKTLRFNSYNIPIYHNPHNDFYRTENFKEKDTLFNHRKYGDIEIN